MGRSDRRLATSQELERRYHAAMERAEAARALPDARRVGGLLDAAGQQVHLPLHGASRGLIADCGLCGGALIEHLTYHAHTVSQPSTHLLFIVGAGSAQFTCGRSELTVTAGQAVWAPARYQRSWYTGACPVRALCFNLEPRAEHDWLATVEPGVRPVDGFAVLEWSLRGMAQEVAGLDLAADQALVAYAGVLVVALRRVLAGCCPVAPDADRLESLWAAVRANPGLPWTVGVLAGHAGMSRSRLFAAVGARYGMTPVQRVNALRIAHAAQLLRSTGLDLGAISAACGFSTSFALSRAFLRATGVRPSVYRRQTRMG